MNAVKWAYSWCYGVLAAGLEALATAVIQLTNGEA